MNTNPYAIRDRISRSSFVLQVILCLMPVAANSIFCRQALVEGQIPPESFTVIRLLSGGLFVLLLIRLRNPRETVGGS